MKKYQTVTKEIDGVKYTAQFNGLRAKAKALDGSYVNGTMNVSIEKLTDYILKNVIVEPANLDIDDFESDEALTRVVEFGTEVMSGNFRGPEIKEQAQAGSAG